jgi:hypothetical protein
VAPRTPVGTAIPSLAQLAACPIVRKHKDPGAVVLALDLSSSCVGWAVGIGRERHGQGKLVFRSTAETGAKLGAFFAFLLALLILFKPERLLIERPMMRRGATTTRHTELLGVARLAWLERTGGELLDTWIISAITVKNVMGVRHGRDHAENKKIMVQKINQLYGLNLKFDKNSKLKSDDDSADALAVWTTYVRRNGGE